MRRGKFILQMDEVMSGDWDLLLNRVRVLSAEQNARDEHIVYTAVSDLFRDVPPEEPTPEYNMNIHGVDVQALEVGTTKRYVVELRVTAIERYTVEGDTEEDALTTAKRLALEGGRELESVVGVGITPHYP